MFIMVIFQHCHIVVIIFDTWRNVVGLSVLQVILLELCVKTLEYPIILNFFEGGLFLSLVNEGMNHLENAFGARVVRHFPVVLIFEALLWPVANKGLLFLFGKIFVFRQTVEADFLLIIFAVGVFEPFNPFLHLILLPGTSSVLRFVLDTPEIFVKFLPGKGLSLLFNLNGALLDHLHLNGFRLIIFVEVED